MARTLEELLGEVRAVRARGGATADELLPLIGSKHAAVAAGAAAMAGELAEKTPGAGQSESVVRALVGAYERFAVAGAKSDKGCVAKLAIVNALCALDHRDGSFYLRGVHTRQLEPGFGGTVDTAGELRGRCAEALVTCLHPGAIVEIAPLLADADVQCRVGAVRAAAMAPGEAGAALLRLKLAVGDPEPLVMGECCGALLGLPGEHAAYVAEYVSRARREFAEAAVAALAESRDPAALAALRGLYERAQTPEQRSCALGAIGHLRVDGAAEFLLDLVAHALHPRAREAVAALHPRRKDESLRRRLAAALEERDDRLLARYAEEVLGSGV